MKTFWTKIITDPDIDTLGKHVDHWCTGYTSDIDDDGDSADKPHYVFALRANEESDIHDFLEKFLCHGSYEVNFINEMTWEQYKDFAGDGTRFPMKQEYLDDPIDTVQECVDRLNRYN